MKFNLFDVRASVVRESFYEFVKEFWDTIIEEPLVDNWHIKYLCDELQFVAERVFKGQRKAYDLVINITPGTSKSTIVSQMFPAWCWTRFPPARFICGSYAKDVAMKDSLKTRDIVQSEGYQKCFPKIQLREDENTKGLFTNTRKGFRLSVGVLGKVTGFHGHFLLIDDPINPEEAFSDADLKRVNRWMRNTLPSRKVDKRISVMILIQQRLHEADPSGDILSRSKGKGIKHICLPAEKTDDINPKELEQFYEEDLFDPVRLPREVLEEMQKEYGAYGYAAQALQRPVPLGGGMFRIAKFKLRHAIPKKFKRKVRSWDKAGTEDDGAYSVGALLGIDMEDWPWILDIVRGQWEAPEREAMIKQTAILDGTTVPILIEVEGGSGGKESGQNSVKGLAGYRVILHHPTGTKEARAYSFASQVGAGNVYCMQSEFWTKDFLDELQYFPRSRYKDQVDASSSGYNWLVKAVKKVGGAWRIKRG